MSSRKTLNPKDYCKIVKEWPHKSVGQLANELQVTSNTIHKAAAELRKQNPEFCKAAKKMTREEIAKEAIRLLAIEGQ